MSLRAISIAAIALLASMGLFGYWAASDMAKMNAAEKHKKSSKTATTPSDIPVESQSGAGTPQYSEAAPTEAPASTTATPQATYDESAAPSDDSGYESSSAAPSEYPPESSAPATNSTDTAGTSTAPPADAYATTP